MLARRMKLLLVHAIFLNERVNASSCFVVDHPGGKLRIQINLFLEFDTPLAHGCRPPARLDSSVQNQEGGATVRTITYVKGQSCLARNPRNSREVDSADGGRRGSANHRFDGGRTGDQGLVGLIRAGPA